MESRMNDDRIEQAEGLAGEIAHAGDKHTDATKDEAAGEAPETEPEPEANVVRTTSPYAPEDVREGETFEQRDPATLRARADAEVLIH